MPSEYRIALEADLLFARHFGRMRIGGFRAAFQSYLAHEDYRRGRPELVDIRGVAGLRVRFADVSGFSLEVARQPVGAGPTPTVILAQPGLQFGVARMYQQISRLAATPAIEVAVFTDEAEALAAFGVAERSIEAMLAAHDFGDAVSVG